jgi:long-chain fatty acid transport protein
MFMVLRFHAIRASVARRAAATMLLLGFAGAASATGFFINQQGLKELGRVGAGNAAAADSLGTIYFNPAGLTGIWDDEPADRPQDAARSRIGIGTHLIVPRSKQQDTGSTAATPGTLGAALPSGGADGRNPTNPTPVPTAYWAHEVERKRLAIGAGITAPFGLAARFPSAWFGRYDAIEAALQTVNLTAVAAYRFDSGVSVGGGIDFQYAHSLLVTAIPNPLTPGGPTAATDGRSETRGHDWTPGFNLGVIAPLTQQTRIGLHYRSGMKHELQGSTTVSGLTGPLAPFNGTVGARADLRLPAIGTVALRHAWSDDLQLLASVDWFDWSRFGEVRVRFDNGSPDAVRATRYRDTFSAAVGAEYRVSPQLSARGGIRYDQTPTTSGFRDTTVPDANRVWLGVGASWRSSSTSAWNFAFNHVIFRAADVGVTRTFFDGTPLASTVTVNGRARSVVNTVAVEYRRAF